MKITNVETLLAGAVWRNWLFVKLTTDEGITGVGEASLEGKEKIVEEAIHGMKRRHVLGSDPFNVEDLWLRMYRDEFYKGGPILSTAISGIELACWDVIGKALNQPVYNLQGGKCRDRIPAYANAWYKGERTPENFARMAADVVKMGYRALKFDPFGTAGRDMDRKERNLAISLVEAVRDAVGPDVEIMVEVHGRFSPYTAIEVGRELERFRPYWYEEAVDPEDVEAMVQVANQVRIPLASGERLYTKYPYREVLARRALTVLQPDIVHAGGFLEARKIAAMADAHFISVAPHNPNGAVASAATLHLDMCTTNFLIQEAFEDFDPPWRNEVVKGGPRVENGDFVLPQGPGWGVELNEDAIKEHPYIEDAYFSLWRSGWEKEFKE